MTIRAEKAANGLLEKDLFSGSMNPEWGINNTVGLWTPLPERMDRLFMAVSTANGRRQILHMSGYGNYEIGSIERPSVSTQTVAGSIKSVELRPAIRELRSIFPVYGIKSWKMDEIIEALRMFNEGASARDVAMFHGINIESVSPKLRTLINRGWLVESHGSHLRSPSAA